MSFKNIYGRLGKGTYRDPETGESYPSLNAYRQARHKANVARLIENDQLIRESKKLETDHFQAWISECCITELRLASGQAIDIEAPVSALRKSYLAWAGKDARTAQAWGRWMGERFVKVNRNAYGVSRVYYGIALKPEVTKNVIQNDK